MSLTSENVLSLLKNLNFHLYHAKSTNESLLIHSFSVYSLLDRVLQFSSVYTEPDKELMRWAALLHDYGKTAPHWQKALRGPHRVTLGDTQYEDLRHILKTGINQNSADLLTTSDIEDILFIIEFHHASGREASTPTRNRMKDVVSECDRAVSQSRISEDLIRTLNTVIDAVRYRLFAIELIEHPISPLVIGAFDYVFTETNRIRPLLYSPTSTLFAAEVDVALPSLEEVNSFLNEQLGPGMGVLRYDGGNGRIYTEERSFLELAKEPDKFVSEATAFANRYCERKRKAAERMSDAWSTRQEEEYLYGRVCGTTYNTLLDLCGVPRDEKPRACLMAGGRYGKVTVESLELFGLRKGNATYERTLRNVLETLQQFVRQKLQGNSTELQPATVTPSRYDVSDLLVPDSSLYR